MTDMRTIMRTPRLEEAKKTGEMLGAALVSTEIYELLEGIAQMAEAEVMDWIQDNIKVTANTPDDIEIGWK